MLPNRKGDPAMTAQEFVLIRKQLGLTQEQLAGDFLSYSRNSVARWETNRRPIRALVALRMTQLLTEHLRKEADHDAIEI
jgi:DNA-binding transcriptional regulator YiaG